MRRLCAGLYHDVVHMSLVSCIQPGRICFYCIRRDVYRHVLGRALVIRRSIFCVLLCFPIRLAGPTCYPGSCCSCLTGDGVRAGLRAYMPLCLGHEVAGLPHHTLEAQALMLPLQAGVATCALGNFDWTLEFVFLGCQDLSPSIS